MPAEGTYRVMIVGTEGDLACLQSALELDPDRFEFELDRPAEGGQLSPREPRDIAPDVAVIGDTVERPLPVAQQLRSLCPKSQIVFLLRPERIDRFRAGLPFVPNLASAWTVSTAAEGSSLAALIRQAARASREKLATAAVFGRINQQIAATKAAPAQLRRSQLALSERYLATILTQSPDAFIAVDSAGHVIAYNDSASNLFSKPLEHRSRIRAVELFPVEERGKLTALLAAAAGGETFASIEVRLDGGDRSGSYAELSLAPVYDGSGSIASVSITARDITERKRGEDRQRLLINELNHRVKNTLAIVQALAHQSFRGNASPAEERAAFEARLSTLSAAHNLLTQQTWKSVRLAQIIAAAAGAACGASATRHRIEGPDIDLAPQTAVSLAMAVHELCTNAIKYGALANESGVIITRWKTYQEAGEQRLWLEWIERGGPPVEPPRTRGFGTRMIERGLASELNGHVQLDFRSEGLVCVIDAPLPRVEA
jgi:PAS domain S-box-containing protein